MCHLTQWIGILTRLCVRTSIDQLRSIQLYSSLIRKLLLGFVASLRSQNAAKRLAGHCLSCYTKRRTACTIGHAIDAMLTRVVFSSMQDLLSLWPVMASIATNHWGGVVHRLCTLFRSTLFTLDLNKLNRRYAGSVIVRYIDVRRCCSPNQYANIRHLWGIAIYSR